MGQIDDIKAQMTQAFSDINDATNNIAADIDRLAGQIAAGGLTVAESQAIADQLTGVSTQLKAIAEKTPDSIS